MVPISPFEIFSIYVSHKSFVENYIIVVMIKEGFVKDLLS